MGSSMRNKQITIGAGLSYLAIGLNLLFALLYTPWMIQKIGKSDYALYTLANSIISIFLLDFGLSSATSKFISNYIAEGKQQEADEFLGVIYRLYFVIDAILLVIFVVLFFFLDAIYVNLSPSEMAKFKVVYCIAAAYSLLNFPFVTLNGILTSYEKFVCLKLADIIYRLLCVGLTVVALSKGLGLYALVTANAIAGIVIIGYKILVISKSTPIRPRFRNNKVGFPKTLLAFSVWTTVTSLAYRLIFNITPSILGIVADSGAIAVFGVVTTIEQYVFLIATAINGMFLPEIARIYAKNSASDDILPLMIKVGKFQFALNCIIVIGFYVLGRQFVFLWLGEEYTEVYLGALLVIAPGIFYNSLQIANTAMIVRDKVKYQAMIMGATGILNIVLSIFLSKYLGAIGSCLSIFVAYTVRAILYHIVHAKMMKLDMCRFIKECYLKMIVPVLSTLIVGYAINQLICVDGWIALMTKGVILLVFYSGITLISYMTREELKQIIHLRR